MPKKLGLILLLSLCTIFSCKKKEKEINKSQFDNRYTIESTLSGDPKTLNVAVNLSPGLHAYAHGEKIGKPVRLEISSTNGWRALGSAETPAGVTKKIAGLGESIVIEGPFNVKQRVEGGVGNGEALLHLQVCSNEACDRPRVHKISFKEN